MLVKLGSENETNDNLERDAISEVGEIQRDGEWWLGSNSKEDGSSLLLIILFQSVILCDLFIFETYVIVPLCDFVVILDYLVLLAYL